MDIKASTVAQVVEWLQLQENIPTHVLTALAEDSRSGVRRSVEQYQRRIAAAEKERQRIVAFHRYERLQRENGFQLVAGIDEAGRGPLAGPVVAAAVILPPDIHIPIINDSKKLLPEQREKLFDIICQQAIAFGIGYAPRELIDEINILQATYCAMHDAVKQLQTRPDILLNDAVRIPHIIDIPQVPIIGGDAVSISIAAASILAKVTRDRLMLEYDTEYPQYGFAKHKGYYTAEHVEALRTYGPCPIHRRSFTPVGEIEEEYRAG